MILRALAVLCLAAGAVHAQQPVFDVHVHLRDGETSLRQYQADAAEAGIELAGIGAMWFGGPHQAREGDATVPGRNQALVALAGRHPQVLPIAVVHPYDGQPALDELANLAEAGVKAVKLHPHTQGFDAGDERLLALVRRAGELGLTVLLDNANILPGDSEQMFNLAARAPRTRFVFAHIGGLNFRFWNILPLTRTADGFAMDNVYFDISATLLLIPGSPLEEEFVWTLRNVGIDNVLLGSDYPQIGLAETVAALERLPLSDEEKDKIRVGNARRLFGL